MRLLPRLSRYLDEVLFYRRTRSEVEARIAEHARVVTMRITRPLLLAACTLGLLWWPFDFVLYANRPDVIRMFALWRTAIIVLSLGYYVTYDRFALVRRHYAVWGTLVGGTMAFVVAASLGALGSLSQPWFGSLYFVPIMSLPFLLSPGPRLLGTLTVSIASLVGFFGVHPSNLAHRDLGTAAGLMLFGVTVSVCAGHAIYHLFRLGFLQSEQLDERTRELEELSRTLVDRVEERTHELRHLAAHVDALHEGERSSLARELHDELGQFLSGMRLELDLAERVRLRGEDTAAAHQNLSALLDATLASTRSILSHLRPRVLDDFGLVAAVEWLAEDMRRRSGLDVRLRVVPEDLSVPDDVAVGVFRVVQESLTNALRHASARQIQVSLMFDAEGLAVTVADDGLGLPPPQARRAGSMGLLGMRERTNSLGGTFEICGSPGGGTRVVVRLPPSRVGAGTGSGVPT